MFSLGGLKFIGSMLILAKGSVGELSDGWLMHKTQVRLVNMILMFEFISDADKSCMPRWFTTRFTQISIKL